MQQWNQLSKTLQEQEIVLLQAKEKLARLNSPSAKLLEQLEKSEQLCSQANSQLIQSQTELANAQSSLKKAYSSIEELKASCQELTRSLKAERAQAKKDKIMGCIIGVLIGIAVGAVVT